jgi:hypothetical protein
MRAGTVVGGGVWAKALEKATVVVARIREAMAVACWFMVVW